MLRTMSFRASNLHTYIPIIRIHLLSLAISLSLSLFLSVYLSGRSHSLTLFHLTLIWPSPIIIMTPCDSEWTPYTTRIPDLNGIGHETALITHNLYTIPSILWRDSSISNPLLDYVHIFLIGVQ